VFDLVSIFFTFSPCSEDQSLTPTPPVQEFLTLCMLHIYVLLLLLLSSLHVFQS